MSELKLNKKITQKIPNILKLIKKGLGTTEISRKCKTTPDTIKKIANANGIQIIDKRKTSKNTIERNNEIIALLKLGNHTFGELSNKYGVSRQRIQQIAIQHGNLSIHAINHNRKEEIVNKIMIDTSILRYDEIKKKYSNFEGFSWLSLKKKFKEIYGIGLYDKLYQTRNITIVNKYSSGQIAKEVLNGSEQELKSPKQMKSERDVYRISSSFGYKKYPKVYNRAAGGMFEDKKILNLIVKLRDLKKMSFSEIAEELNNKGYKTVSGFTFSTPNVVVKYRDYKTKNKRVRKVN
jgi:hypothetical protein